MSLLREGVSHSSSVQNIKGYGRPTTPKGKRLCRKVVTNILLSTINGIFDVPSFQYVVWFVNFATEPVDALLALLTGLAAGLVGQASKRLGNFGRSCGPLR